MLGCIKKKKNKKNKWPGKAAAGKSLSFITYYQKLSSDLYVCALVRIYLNNELALQISEMQCFLI